MILARAFGILLLGACLGMTGAQAQTCCLSNTIWAGYLKGTTKEVAHYQGSNKTASVTGATANQVPMEIWFPTATTFCAVFNNSTIRASAVDGRNGIQVHDGHLYDLAVGVNPDETNPMLEYWKGTGTVDLKKKSLSGTTRTEDDDADEMMVVASYSYKKTGNVETLTVRGTAVLPVQGLDLYGDGWKLNPGLITFTGTFTKTARQVSVEGSKQGSEGF